MARIRSIKPDACTDERLADCSPTARLLFILMQCFCDDGGIHPAKPRTLKAEVFPMDDFSADEVSGFVGELIRAGLIQPFESGGQRFWEVRDWSSLQKIEKPSFKYPRPDGTDSTPDRQAVNEGSSNARPPVDDGSPAEGKGREGMEGREEQSATPPAAHPKSQRKTPDTRLPTAFAISDRVRQWANEKGFGRLEEHLESFRMKSTAKDYRYADWDAAFMVAVAKDWAGLREKNTATRQADSGLHADEQFALVVS